MVATLAEGVVPWWGAIAECHLRICGRHGVVLLLGAMVGYHCWVPCCFIAGGPFPGCHSRLPLVLLRCGAMVVYCFRSFTVMEFSFANSASDNMLMSYISI